MESAVRPSWFILELSSYIDHTLLSPTATREQIEKHCGEAIEYKFCSVCVQPRWVSLAADIVHGSGVKVDAVVGFPFGAEVAKIKAVQAKEMVMAGADEIDMVADLAAIIEADEKYLYNDIKTVADVCKSVRPALTLKVIIESAALTDEQTVFACKTASEAGADFVKTSTGYHASGGANIGNVMLMAKSAPTCKVKAAGGIRTAREAIAMIEAGASRIGTSEGVAIIEEHRRDPGEASEQ